MLVDPDGKIAGTDEANKESVTMDSTWFIEGSPVTCGVRTSVQLPANLLYYDENLDPVQMMESGTCNLVPILVNLDKLSGGGGSAAAGYTTGFLYGSTEQLTEWGTTRAVSVTYNPAGSRNSSG